MNTPFEFATSAKIVFGPGKFKEIGLIAREIMARPLVVAGRDTRRAEPLLETLCRNGLEPSIFSAAGEPAISTVTEGTALAQRQNSDGVIGFGGGSALDTAKAISILATNAGELLDYLEVVGHGRPLTHPALPCIAVPTTAGTGAEVTRNAVIASPQHRAKASLRSHHMLPRVALVDPELTFDLPPHLTAASGMDALTQLIEPFVSSRANPLVDALCREAIPRVARSLPRAFKDGASSQAREDLALASLFSGIALSNAGLGAVHGFAGVIGGMFSAPHGAICATLLPRVMDANLKAVRERHPERAVEARFGEIARMLTGNPAASAEDGVRWVEELVAALRIPSLSSYDIAESDLGGIVFKSQKASSMKGNPVGLTPEELCDILRRAL